MSQLRLSLKTRLRQSARRDPVLVGSIAVLAVLIVASVGSRFIPSLADTTSTMGPRLSPPAAGWPLGTDSLGRSLLNRLLAGVGTTLLLSAFAVICTAIISTALGLAAAYRGGWLRELVLRFGDVLYAFPAIILAILIAAVVGPGQTAALTSIVLVTVPLMTRMVASAATSVVQRDFVKAAVISGVPSRVILVRHLLRNVAGTVAVQTTYALSVGILVEGGLSFLGYGVQLPGSSLGLLIQEGSLYMVRAPWLLVAPGLVIVLAILAVNLIGDSLRDRFDPRETRELV
ncbi:ABC transporter permease [Rhodococcus qingshengii]|uniref:ABC transporter permease n=1 Tax=Rhodococcus qingshengii TaxID=334542 RepID=UPI0036DBF365